MGGVAKTIKNVAKKTANGFDKFVHSDAGWVFPMVKGPAMLIEKGSGMRPSQQYTAGAVGGAGIAAAGAAGLLGSANAWAGGAGAAGAGGAAGGGAGTSGAVSGSTAAFGQGGAGVMAQSGGVPLMTKVLLGSSVASTLANYFGKKPGQDYNDFLDQLDPQSRAEVDRLQSNLEDIQGNLDMRNQAVQKLVDDFPNVVAQATKDRAASRDAYDEASKQVLDHASSQLAAKFGANGGFNSGSFNQGLADEAYKVAMPKAQMVRDDALAGVQDNYTAAQLRLANTEALRNFQQTMLTGATGERFSASQNYLANAGQNNRQAAQLTQQQDMANQQSTNQLFGSLGNTLGMAAMMGNYNQMYNVNGGSAAPQARVMRYPGSESIAGMGA